MTLATPARTCASPATEGDHLRCTVVIPTRRRCPEPTVRLHHNPLCQCLDSILAQSRRPRQVLVVAARADDYIEPSLALYERSFAKQGVDLTVLWMEDRDGLGPFGKIAAALPAISNELVHLVEDDVFLHPDTLAGAAHLMGRLRPRHPNLGLLHLPIYRRATRPTKFLPHGEIGRLGPELRLTGCFESVCPLRPRNQSVGRRRANSNRVLTHRIDFFRGGNNLVTRSALEALRGMPLGTPYGWEVCAGLHLRQQRFELYHCPYSTLAGMHSAYGVGWGRSHLVGRDWTSDLPNYRGLSLSDIVRNAVADRRHTGLGPLPLPVYYFRVATCYALILRHYAPVFFLPWLRKLRDCFVDRLHSDLTAGRQKVTDRAVREAIFLAALDAIEGNVAWLPGGTVLRRIGALVARPGRDRRALLARPLGSIRLETTDTRKGDEHEGTTEADRLRECPAGR